MHATATDEVGLLTSKGGVCVDVLGRVSRALMTD